MKVATRYVTPTSIIMITLVCTLDENVVYLTEKTTKD